MRRITLLVLVGAIAMVLALGSTAFGEKIKWRMGSTWTPAINLYHGDKEMIKYVKEMTGGNFEITWFPAGSLMKAFEWFDGCSKGVVEMAADWPSYWAGKDPAFDFLGSFPFGFTNTDYVIWMYEFGGLEKMQELYGKYGMTTIWIMKQIGAAPIKMPGGEIYLAVERGTLDGAEFSSPGIDWEMGFAEITKYWSVPCWFQPASQVGVMVNLKAYNSLSKEYQAILRYACKAAALDAIAFYEGDSGRAIEKFIAKGTEIFKLDDASLRKLEDLAGQYCLIQAKKSKEYAKLLKSQMEYLEEYKDWRDMTGRFGQGSTPAYLDKVLAELKKMGY